MPRVVKTYDSEVVPERVDGVAVTLVSTPADEGLEADDTSRSMALRRREWVRIVSGEGARRRSAHDEERVQDDALVAQLDDQTPAFADCNGYPLIGHRNLAFSHWPGSRRAGHHMPASAASPEARLAIRGWRGPPTA